MAVFSKALGNGYAIAAVLGRSEVMSAAQSTFVPVRCGPSVLGQLPHWPPLRPLNRVGLVRIGISREKIQEVGNKPPTQQAWPLRSMVLAISHYTFPW